MPIARALADDFMTRYLLGELSEEEREDFEDRYLRDQILHEQLLAACDDLVVAYVRGELPEPARARFEEHFLGSPDHRQEVEWTRELLEALDSGSLSGSTPDSFASPVARWWRLPLGLAASLALAAGIAALAASLWLASERARLVAELKRVEVEQVTARQDRGRLQERIAQLDKRNAEIGESLSQERERTQLSALPSGVVGLLLSPGSLRSGGTVQRLRLPWKAAEVRLTVELSRDTFQTYRAVLETPDGKETWASGSVKSRATPAGRALVLTLPAKVLSDGDYVLSVTGFRSDGTSAEAGEYAFAVART